MNYHNFFWIPKFELNLKCNQPSSYVLFEYTIENTHMAYIHDKLVSEH